MRLKLLVVSLLAVLVGVSCSGGGKGVLESGAARIPDDAGIVTDSTLERIQLDGKRDYVIAENVESFKTRSHSITSLLSWEGKYVHIGLDADKKVEWIAGIGTIVKGSPSLVFYSGILKRFDAGKHRATFDDGTVLTVDDGVDVPKTGNQIVCQIDPSRKLVTKITPG